MALDMGVLTRRKHTRPLGKHDWANPHEREAGSAWRRHHMARQGGPMGLPHGVCVAVYLKGVGQREGSGDSCDFGMSESESGRGGVLGERPRHSCPGGCAGQLLRRGRWAVNGGLGPGSQQSYSVAQKIAALRTKPSSL